MLTLKKQIKVLVLPTKNSWWILQLTGKKKTDSEKISPTYQKKQFIIIKA
jgi:hypothetical protein